LNYLVLCARPGSPGNSVPIVVGHSICRGRIIKGFTLSLIASQQDEQWVNVGQGGHAGLPVLSDRGLLFLTGGLAVGDVSSSGSVNVASSALVSVSAWNGSNSTTRTGYTVGGGFEYALTDHWTTKAEYLWYDLGHASHPLNCAVNTNILGGCAGTPAFPGYTTLGTTVSSVRGSIVRVGLNYKFDYAAAPAVYK
jgi:outer membrane immunogenic protein